MIWKSIGPLDRIQHLPWRKKTMPSCLSSTVRIAIAAQTSGMTTFEQLRKLFLARVVNARNVLWKSFWSFFVRLIWLRWTSKIICTHWKLVSKYRKKKFRGSSLARTWNTWRSRALKNSGKDQQNIFYIRDPLEGIWAQIRLVRGDQVFTMLCF